MFCVSRNKAKFFSKTLPLCGTPSKRKWPHLPQVWCQRQHRCLLCKGWKLPRVEVLFSPFVRQRLAELSADLCGEVDGNKVAILGDHGLQRRKLLKNPKARMDTYCVNRTLFNLGASNIDTPLKACDVQEAEFVSVQLFEQDVQVLTMMGYFLDCSSTTSTCLLEEVSHDEGTSEGTRQLVRMLLDLERSRGQVVGHLLSSAITLD